MGSKSHWIHKTTLESPPSTISSGSKFKPIDPNEHRSSSSSPHPSQLIHTAIINNRNHLAQWDSHLNMQQLVKNRTKLKTPNSDSESIEAYAKTCRTRFDRKCAKSQNINYHHHQGKSNQRPAASASAIAASTTKALIKTISERDQPIYTKPYSTDSYSDIRQNISERSATGHGHLKGKQQTDIIAAYTSVTGSDGFLSPNSISIGVAANSTSNTTTSHQYDTKISIGLQTTDTLQRMPIIQLKNPIETVNEPIEQTTTQATATVNTTVKTTTTTMRVNKFTVNKQLQVRPESLAYIIVFKDNDGAQVAAAASDENVNSMNGQERGNQLYGNSQRRDFAQRHLNWTNDHSSNSSGSSSISDGLKQNQSKDQLKSTNEQAAINSNRRVRTNNNSGSSGSSFENLTLQEYLQAHRPVFYANAEQRRKCLNDLHNLR